jgi:hypothetical protein
MKIHQDQKFVPGDIKAAGKERLGKEMSYAYRRIERGNQRIYG